MTDVTVVGAGRMGLAIAANLVRRRYHVDVVDDDGQRRNLVLEAGESWAARTVSPVDGNSMLVTALAGSPELQQAILDARNQLRAARGCSWVDITGAAPELDARLHAAAVAAPSA